MTKLWKILKLRRLNTVTKSKLSEKVYLFIKFALRLIGCVLNYWWIVHNYVTSETVAVEGKIIRIHYGWERKESVLQNKTNRTQNQLPIKPLISNSDQHKISPSNISTSSKEKVMRIKKMITKEQMFWSFIQFSQLILKRNVWRLVWRICLWDWGLKD